MASSSSNVGSRSRQPQVFINFRGSELRNNFISFLEPALINENINTFIDKQELRSRDLAHLFVRIEESKIALVIFSKEYTTSEWCLDELAKIKECSDEGKLDVIPIFYKVKPSDVKYIAGYFKENFVKLKNRYRDNPDKIRKWEEALMSISQKFGLTFPENSENSENQFIMSIIEEVKKLLANISTGGNQSGQSNQNGIFFPARKLEIGDSLHGQYWTWSSINDASSDVPIEIATLNMVFWLAIKGNSHTRKLIPGIRYEVFFVVKLEETASGWDEPVKLILKLITIDKRENVQENLLYLEDYIGDGWVDIKVGDFVAPPHDASVKIVFVMEQNDAMIKKTGLVVKGVAIRVVN